METNESIKMTFPNKLSYFFLVQLFVREIAQTVGFSGRELNQIDIAVEESVSNIMVHNSVEELPSFDIVCEKIPGGIKIILKDMGIPFDPDRIKKYELSKNPDDISASGLGIYLIQKMMDDLSFRNLGTGGKETVMIKYLPGTAELKEEIQVAEIVHKPEIISEKIEYDVRRLDENEAIEISRCAYKTHGFTFFDDHIYFPDRLIEMNRTSQMISVVAVTKDHVFMGHLALLYQYPEDTIAELTFAFVNLEFRGQGVLNRMVDYIFEIPKKRELRGSYAYAVTNHIFTQKSMVKSQFKECGIMLATSPSSWKFKGIDDTAQRISVLLSFKYITPPVRCDIFIPEHHKAMVGKIYDNLGINHHCVIPSADENRFDASESVLEGGLNELEGCVELYVIMYGADILHQLRKALRNYCLQQISAINVFLKLTDPRTYWLTAEIEKMGFFFAGILPESRIGDALILQYLNNVPLEYDKIELLSDLSRELLNYIKERDPNIID